MTFFNKIGQIRSPDLSWLAFLLADILGQTDYRTETRSGHSSVIGFDIGLPMTGSLRRPAA